MRVDPVAWAFVLSAASAGAQPLGTLLHSAPERARLEAPARIATPRPAGAPTPPPAVTGFVARSDGRGTVFVGTRAIAVDALSSRCPTDSAGISGSQTTEPAGHCNRPIANGDARP